VLGPRDGRVEEPNPLEQLDLAQLRRRTSIEWRTHADDVLPLWFAEMDVVLAAPVQEALVTAVGEGDTGYPCGSGYAQALAGFGASHLGVLAHRAALTDGGPWLDALVRRMGSAAGAEGPGEGAVQLSPSGAAFGPDVR
jgi:bifunctional pyridoxal-dependent enzyme with beta-cystathionase and maltose regulon repressor activities